MKKALLTAAALTLVSGAAFASKARLTALGGAAHATDTQTIYTKPADMHATGDFVAVEFGANSPKAEGAFVKTMGDYKLGVSLGHNEGFANTAETTMGFAGVQNPFAVAYGAKSGDMNWAAAFGYSSADGKDSKIKSSAMKVFMGASTEAWDAYAHIGLGASATGQWTDADGNGTVNGAETVGDADATYKGTSGLLIGGGMRSESIYYYGSYGMDGYKVENTAAMDHEMAATSMTLGMVNSHKADGVDFFYGLSYEMTEMNNKTASNKDTSTALPLLVGIEAEAATWMTLRGSIKQNLPFVTESKSTAASLGNLGNSTVVAAGAGLKFGKATLDFTLDAGTTGVVSAAPIGGNAALTYLF